MTSWTLWWFLGPVATLADSNGPCNKIQLQPTEQKPRRSGARSIFLPSSNLRYGRPACRILPYRLQHFGSQGLCYAPQKFWCSKAVVAAGVSPIGDSRVVAHSLKFSDAFDAVYWSRRRPVWSKLNMFFTKLFVIVTRWQQFFVLLNKFLKANFFVSTFFGSPCMSCTPHSWPSVRALRSLDW